MSEKTDKAIARITDECKGNEHLIPFEEYLTSICTTDDVADKILNRDKSLKGCFEKMKSAAGQKITARISHRKKVSRS